jgi:hypothetical protein
LGRGARMRAAREPWLRRWAPFGLLAVAPAVGVLAGAFVPSGPRGHWSDHLASGVAAGGQLLAVVVGAVLARRRLNVLLLVLVAVVAVGLVLEVVGNQRVAASIWLTSYDDQEAGVIGPTLEGFESGHALAAVGDWMVILGGLAFALTLRAFRRVGDGMTVAGSVLSLLPPPFILPAVGVVLLLAFVLRGPAKAVGLDASSVTPPDAAAT